ncbi:adenosine kinase-like [Diorhabda sublineata]|uniref:adenosine kinase-like n=1 Tax=Diorhabda sublineata TaxID=1163346 RepID=UPI0024E0E174|nr:adenosine kinase-like [Diorhabda sublineata]
MENQLCHKKLRTNLIIGIGHPLLDITATVQNDFLKKYDLKENDAILITEKQKDMLEELMKFEVKYTVGGSIQNTLRVVQWLTKVHHLTTFFGSIGNDKFADIMYSQATLDGVNVRYKRINEPTGTCMVLITGNNRSLCTNPGSSKNFDFEYLVNEENITLLQTAKYYYLGGFFLNVCLKTVTEVAKLAAKNNRQFLFNLSAPFICHLHKEVLFEIVPYIDVLFGNRSEIEALAESFKIDKKSLQDKIRVLINWKKVNKVRTRLVVITQGENHVLVGIENKILTFSVPKLEKNKIVDTNCAGDAFVGGFLSQYIQDHDVEACVKCGIWAASEIIQKDGCTYNNETDYKSS